MVVFGLVMTLIFGISVISSGTAQAIHCSYRVDNQVDCSIVSFLCLQYLLRTQEFVD